MINGDSSLLVWSITGVLGIANFGLGEATLRYVAHHYADGDLEGVNRVFGATLTFYLLICTLISCILWTITPWLVNLVRVPGEGHYPVDWLIRLTALLFSVGMVSNVFSSISMALRRYDISSKIGTIQAAVRSVGLIVLVLTKVGILYLVVWEVVLASMGLVVQVYIAKRLLPGLRCAPSMSIGGIREIIGYGMLSFLTHIFLMVYREGGKLLLGNRIGTASVAYFGTPDSISHRLHMIIVSAMETLVPGSVLIVMRQAARLC